MTRLENRKALVTGATGAIGRAVALALAREGADVVVHHTTPEEQPSAAATVREIERMGRMAVALQANLADSDGAFTLLQSAVSGFGRVDILVNNAGLRPTAPIEETTVEMFDAVMAANMRGVFLMTRLVLPLMLAQDYGRIVNTVSDVVYHGAPGCSLYGAAAGAVLGFTRSLVHDIGPRNVTVNCVAPGALRPKEASSTLSAGLESLRRSLPSQRLAEPEDVAAAYVFLASDEARHMVGQCISPSGGAVML